MMRFTARSLRLLAAGLSILAPLEISAQSPWTVTVTPRLNPLPIGYCSPIQITVLDPSIRDAPRNSRGFRVTIAHFDMTVAGESVVGQQIDANFWQVCACQGGVAGTPITVTATYPAQSLDAATSIPGVAFQQTGTLVLARPNGTLNPPACSAAATVASAQPRAVVAPPQIASVVTPTPAPTPVSSVAPSVAVGRPIARAPQAARQPIFAPGPVSVTPTLSAQGNWYEPGPVSVNPALIAQGNWYEPGPVTVTPTLSATGNWIEPTVRPTRLQQPARPSP